MKKIILLVLIVFVLPEDSFGQYTPYDKEELIRFNSIPKEKVFVHSNDNLLLSGEYLYYKFYCRNAENNAPTEISKIGYVSLIGKNDKLIFQHKIKLTNGRGQGDFFVPVDIQTGHYKLIGYTQWMRNKGEQSFFIEDFVIVNPYQELPHVEDKLLCEEVVHSRIDSPINSSSIEAVRPSFQIRLPEKKFGKRQLAKFEIVDVTARALGNVSISIRKIDSIKLPFKKTNSKEFETNMDSKTRLELRLKDSIYLPELRGELISGRLISTTSKLPIPYKNVSLSVTGNEGLAKISRSNKEGAFYFNLNLGARKNEVIFDILGENKEEIEIIFNTAIINTNSFAFKELDVSPDLNPIFEKRSIYNQIENAFFEQKDDSLLLSTNAQIAYKDFQETYDLDDFTRFNTLQETIVEIIDDVLVKKRKGQYRIQIRGIDESFIKSDDTPLLLADNVLIQNATDLFEYDVKKIRRIGISRADFYLGPKKYQGVFSIETKDGDYLKQGNSGPNSIRLLQGPLPTKEYYRENYASKSRTSTKNIADFRQQLLWLPNSTIDKIGTFEFYTSDNKGTYEISVEGFTKNGVPISLSEKIYVE